MIVHLANLEMEEYKAGLASGKKKKDKSDGKQSVYNLHRQAKAAEAERSKLEHAKDIKIMIEESERLTTTKKTESQKASRSKLHDYNAYNSRAVYDLGINTKQMSSHRSQRSFDGIHKDSSPVAVRPLSREEILTPTKQKSSMPMVISQRNLKNAT